MFYTIEQFGRRFGSPLKQLNAEQRIGWLCVNYGLFLFGFFTLGFFSEDKGVALVNFALDAVLCALSLVLCAGLFSRRYKVPLAAKLALLLVALCFTAFTVFAFLLPENGIPPVIFQ